MDFRTSCLVATLLLAVTLASPAHKPSSAIKPRIGGSDETAQVLHAVLVIVYRADHEAGRGAIGGGSIVSQNRVITAAHVVVDQLSIEVGFYISSVLPANLRTAAPFFVQTMTGFDPATLHNDIAVLQFRLTPFPTANIIPLTNVASPTGDASLASYGFTTPTDTRPSLLPLLAEHTIDTCAATLGTTETHFCATATAPAVVCPGDNGSGLYSPGIAPALPTLLGLVSTLDSDCTTAAQSAFTNLGVQEIRDFLESQQIPVAALAAPAPVTNNIWRM